MRQTTHFSGCRDFLHRTIAAALGALAIGAAQAEDIDVFAGGPGATSKPNVLIILDNSSNWSSSFVQAPCFAPGSGNRAPDKKFHSEVCALSTVALGLTDRVRLGLMLFAETGTNGAYVRFGLRDMNTQNKTAFSTL